MLVAASTTSAKDMQPLIGEQQKTLAGAWLPCSRPGRSLRALQRSRLGDVPRECSSAADASQLPDLRVSSLTWRAQACTQRSSLSTITASGPPAWSTLHRATMRPTRRPLAEWPCRAKGQSASAGSNACRLAGSEAPLLVWNSTDHSRGALLGIQSEAWPVLS